MDNIYQQIEAKYIGNAEVKTFDNKVFKINMNYITKSKFILGDQLVLIIEADGFIKCKKTKLGKKELIIAEYIGNNMVTDGEHNYRILPTNTRHYQFKDGEKLIIIKPILDEPFGGLLEVAVDNKL